MKRRAFIPLAVGCTVAPMAAFTQSRIPVVGVLDPGDQPDFVNEFRKTLAGLGYVEGKTIRLEVRSGENNADILDHRASELVRLKVDVIATRLTTALRAAMRATTDIPIVMCAVGGPVETRLVASLARPGGNVTGMSLGGIQISPKRMEIVRGALPTARRIAFISNAGDPFSTLLTSTMGEIGRGLGLQPLQLPSTTEGMETMLATLVRERPDAVYTMANLPQQPIAETALKAGIPLFATQRSGVVAGALMSYGGRLDDQYRGAAIHVDRILRGAKPASLPVEEPSRFEMFINMKTARTLGIVLPRTLLAQADELIE
jgi:putative ABC transport system substrate-binding protein